MFVGAIAFVLGELLSIYSIQMCILGFILIEVIGITSISFTQTKKMRKRGIKVEILLLPLFFLAGTYCMSIGTNTSFFAENLKESKDIEAYGVVKNISYGEKQVITIDKVIVTDEGNKWELKEALVYCSQQYNIKIGNVILVKGSVFPFETPTNLGQFHMKEYYMALNIEVGITANELIVIDHRVEILGQGILQLKNLFSKGIDKVADESDGGIYKGIFLGDRSCIGEEINMIYDICGIVHILSISGMHISCIGMGIYYVTRKLFGSYVISGVVSAVVIVMYGSMTGMGVSTRRAVVMFLCILVANAIGRCSDMLNNLGLACIEILISYPRMIFQCGFLLSFLAIVGLGLIYPVLKKWYGKKHPLILSLCGGISVQVITLPILAWFYYTYSWYSIGVNLFVVPLVVFLLFSAAMAGGFGLICTPIGIFFSGIGHYVLWLIEEMGKICIKQLGGKWVIGKPTIWQILLYYLLLLGFIYLVSVEVEKKKKEKRIHMPFKKTVVFFLLNTAILLTLVKVPNKNLTVTMLDVGQGESIHIETRLGEHILIDGGSSTVDKVGEYRIEPYLLAKGVSHIEYMIISHTDEDHISGVLELMKKLYPQITIGTVMLPKIQCESSGLEEILSLCERNQIPVAYIKKGDVITMGELTLTCLHPEKESYFDNTNDYSVVLELEYKKFSMLFTGDISMEEEGNLSVIHKPITVLKVAHHGSKHSTGEEFLQEIQPKYAIISCGRNNPYRHPSKELINRLEEEKIPYVTTSSGGAIEIQTSGEQMKIRTYLVR